MQIDSALISLDRTYDEISAITNQLSSPTAALLTKVFYDQTQRVSNISTLAGATYDLAKQY